MENKTEKGNTTYIFLGVVGVLILITGVYFLMRNSGNTNSSPYATPKNPVTNRSSSANNSNTTPSISKNSSDLTNKSDGIDSQLDKDTADIGNSLNKLNQDMGTSNKDTNNQSSDTPPTQ